MILSWLRARRRRKLLATPFPEEWLAYVERNVWQYAGLRPEEQARLRDVLRVLVVEKNWEGCRGLVLTDEMKVTIAAQASLLLLGLEHDYYPRVLSILVNPAGFVPRNSTTGPDGVVRPEAGRLGEAWYRGPVVLSWASIRPRKRSAEHSFNLVIHEFAHQLDMEDREIDGTPPLETAEQYRRWQQVMRGEHQKLVKAAAHGDPTFLDTYGASDPAEFFAVASESFFEAPAGLLERHAELYAILKDFYRQDPANRM